MRSLEAAAGSDQGRVRERNEDAYWMGDNVYAVADGMGGHLAGDVASTTALMPVRDLDGRVFSDATSAQAALLDAILGANAAVVRKAAREPDLQGMGTTLTATIVEGRRLHVGHVGDSRAYLLRQGRFIQLTRDHTLVAQLLEQGQLTAEQAASHPQRSIITRAIGVDVDLEVDTMTIELEDGDQILLCSDGLTGPVDDDEIRETLEAGHDADTTVDRLIARANEKGGRDNITVVLLRYREDEGPRTGSVPATLIRPERTDEDQSRDWAEKIAKIGSFRSRSHPELPEDAGADTSSTWQRLLAWLFVLLLVAGLTAAGGRWLLSRSYFVGVENEQVAIFHGIPASAGPLDFYWLDEVTSVPVAEIADWKVDDLERGIAAADRADAEQIVTNLPRDLEEDDATTAAPEDVPDATPGQSPGAVP